MEAPHLAKLHTTYRDRGFSVLAVVAWDSEGEEEVKAFVKKCNLEYPVLLKGSAAARDWGVRSIPDNFFIDREGKVIKRMGEITEKKLPKATDLIERLLK